MRQFLCKPNAEASSLDYAEAQPKIAKQKTMRQFLCKLSAEEVYLLCRNAAKNRAKFENFAAIAQLVEHNLAKVRVASSSLVCRSKLKQPQRLLFFVILLYTTRELATRKKINKVYA